MDTISKNSFLAGRVLLKMEITLGWSIRKVNIYGSGVLILGEQK
jgi:hypothetical protein